MIIDPRKETVLSRIPTPATIDTAPAASRPLLEAVKKQLVVVPNMFASCPTALGLTKSANSDIVHTWAARRLFCLMK